MKLLVSFLDGSGYLDIPAVVPCKEVSEAPHLPPDMCDSFNRILIKGRSKRQGSCCLGFALLLVAADC
jgi:hypothetical protein